MSNGYFLGSLDEKHPDAYSPERLSDPQVLHADFVRPHIEIIKGAINAECEREDAQQAVHEISTILADMEDAVQLGLARLRLLIHKTAPVHIGPIPAWLEEQRHDLMAEDPDIAPPHPVAVESAFNLVSAAIAAHPCSLQAEVTRAPLGRVLVDWDVPAGRLQWLVSSSDIPWPGVSLRAFFKSETKAPLESKLILSAFEAIKQFGTERTRRETPGR